MGLYRFVKIGDKIKEKRISLGLSQKAMAEKLDINRTTYSNYENNNREPNIETLQKIVNALNIDIETLVLGDYDKEKEMLDMIESTFNHIPLSSAIIKQIALNLTIPLEIAFTIEEKYNESNEYLNELNKLTISLSLLVEEHNCRNKDDYLSLLKEITSYINYKIQYPPEE